MCTFPVGNILLFDIFSSYLVPDDMYNSIIADEELDQLV